MIAPPDILAWALEKDNYSKDGADYTTTEILKPPQLTYLAAKHEPRPMPLYKSFMSLLGTGVHNALEDAAPKGAIVEQRFYTTFSINGENVVLGGKPDFVMGHLLDDYKVILVGGKPKPNPQGVLLPKPDHYWQGLFNAYLARKNGHEITTCSTHYVFRDWNYGESKRNPNYPQKPNMPVTFAYTSDEQVEASILERLTLHVNARKGINTPCSDDDRWKHPDVWALKKPVNKRARKLCYSEHEANTHKKEGEVVDFRPGTCVRCNDWCEFSHVCPQHNTLQLTS